MKDLTDGKSPMDQVMAWCQVGNKPLRIIENKLLMEQIPTKINDA